MFLIAVVVDPTVVATSIGAAGVYVIVSTSNLCIILVKEVTIARAYLAGLAVL